MSDSWHRNAIAITGIAGSGKSSAASIFRELGGFVVSADELARRVVEPGTPGLKQVAAAFGAGILTPDGSLNRQKLGAIVFNDEAARRKLELITHPLIGDLAAAEFAAAKKEGRSLLFYDCPLLFEAGLDARGFRKIILVVADRQKIIERLVAARGWTVEEAERRLDSQIGLEEKTLRSDIIIENNGTIEELRVAVGEVWKQLMETA
jgi:dephospho-CoA kinase